jgi:hypothetical protein
MYTISLYVIGETRDEVEAALIAACDDIARSPNLPGPDISAGYAFHEDLKDKTYNAQITCWPHLEMIRR